MIYGSSDLECNRQNFLPKKLKFEKMKKAPGDIINLPMCTINDNHMMYGS